MKDRRGNVEREAERAVEELARLPWDLEEAIEAIIRRYQAKPTALIMMLQDVQKHYNYLPKAALELVAAKMQLPMAQVYGVATYYSSFSLEPKGRHHICVCTGTACHVRGAPIIIEHLERVLGIPAGHTTEDLEFSFETVNCLGACALAPLVTADEEFVGSMTVARLDKLIAELREGAKRVETSGGAA